MSAEIVKTNQIKPPESDGSLSSLKLVPAIGKRIAGAGHELADATKQTASSLTDIPKLLWRNLKASGKSFSSDNKIIGSACGAVGLVGTALTPVSVASASVITGAEKVGNAVSLLTNPHDQARSLTKNELAAAKSVFGNSIDYDKVLVKEEVFRDKQKQIARADGNTIYISNHEQCDSAVMVHELTHVKQESKSGTATQKYNLGAADLDTRITKQDKYDFTKSIANGKHFNDFTPEYQAAFVQDLYSFGFFSCQEKTCLLAKDSGNYVVALERDRKHYEEAGYKNNKTYLLDEVREFCKKSS